ncbi:Tn3 family transposase [Streptomyces sp. UG1]|uniref:Tn3 family transposase n=1 Tax=Streptomyces sp. UG1 TaxID=3417652 RepID=UPI003CF41BD6
MPQATYPLSNDEGRSQGDTPWPAGICADASPAALGEPSPDLRREIHGGLQVMENRNSANTVQHYGKDGALTGPDKEHAETLMFALHLLQSILVHTSTLLLRRVLAGPGWAKEVSGEDRRVLAALFWPNANPYGPFRLEMGKRFNFALPVVPRPRTSASIAGQPARESREGC